jgi:AcrR family transcriptional regulator
VTIRLPAAERRAQLVDAALALFAAEGFQSTTMDAVAAEAGVTKPVLYQHFPSKRELFLELLRDVGRRLSENVGAATAAAASPREMVENGFAAYFDFVSEHPDQFRLLFGEGVRIDAEFAVEVMQVERSIAEFIAGLITIEDLDTDERLVLAHGIVGLAEGTGRHWTAAGCPGEASVLASQVAHLAWYGLRGSAHSTR